MNNTEPGSRAAGAVPHLLPVGMGETLSWERFPDGFLTAADN